ncbi:MAG: cell division protein FtsK [Gammaproteobacteria bacterium]|nr:MAG: cell division protein FtsK [Gammaproteobacteria bacterium]
MTKKTTQTPHRFALVSVFASIFILLIIAALLAVALLSYHAGDPAWSHSDGTSIKNVLGIAGAWYSDISFSLLGKLSYLMPIAMVVFAVHAWFEKGIDKELLSWRLVMLMTAILSGCVLWTKHDPTIINTVAQTGGGALGTWLTIGLEKSIKSVPVIMGFSLVVFVVSLSLLFNFPWLRVMEWIGGGISRFFALLFAGFAASKNKKQAPAKMTAEAEKTSPAQKTAEPKDVQDQLPPLSADKTETRPTFTIDRYQPEEQPTTADKPKPSPSARRANETPDLSYLGIRDLNIKRHDESDKAAPPTGLSGEIEQLPPTWESPAAEEDNLSDAIPLSPFKLTKHSPKKEEKPEKSEPSLLDLGRIKKASISRSAFEAIQSTVMEKNAAGVDMDKLAASSIGKDATAVGAPSYQDSLVSDHPNAEHPVEQFEPRVAPLAGRKVSPPTADVIEPTPELQESLKYTPEPVIDKPTPAVVNVTKAVDTVETVPQKTVPHKTVPQKSKATIGQAYDFDKEAAQIVERPYELPGINLLDTPPPQTNSYTEDTLADMALVLETTLKQFNVTATVMHVSPGPVITRFEIDLAPGIQAKKITNLSQDLARALAVSRVRVEEVIVGSSYVGLEVPNKSRETVYFKDVVCSKPFQDSKSPLTVSLGSDTSGKPVVADLMKMPHALVAGTTGSGKSVCINVMLLSMLYKASPKDLRLILVDPKMLEMSMYEDIPHLLTPVITDMNEAENALTWAVGEMERRYQLMAALKVRKIDAFNEQIDAANARGEPIKDPLWQPNESVGYTHHPDLERLPFIVIVIDELADMMMVVGKQVEQLIARLTQKARAAGIHVVLATQRPSTDVLTGLIKANVPTRIAFQVSSGTDSRVIIDSVGAEKLLGHGDMLYVPPGASHPQRLHGAFVGDAETDRVTNYLRSMGEPDYIAGITIKQDPETLGAFGAAEVAEAKEDADPLYEEAVQIVLETGKASISSVQRQLRIGYNRAARMIEDMQEQGIVSEPVNGVRKVLGGSR